MGHEMDGILPNVIHDELNRCFSQNPHLHTYWSFRYISHDITP